VAGEFLCILAPAAVTAGAFSWMIDQRRSSEPQGCNFPVRPGGRTATCPPPPIAAFAVIALIFRLVDRR
jgi:hypothetical protein